MCRKLAATLLLAAFWLLAGLAPPRGSAQSTPTISAAPPDPKTYALLVGCTTYDHLPKELQLQGPRNDVALLRTVLVEKFRFDPQHIATLVEGEGDERRPLRRSIEREFARLAALVGPGDRVVVLLSGHGSRQPSDPAEADDIETDGLDEVFCPADVECVAAAGEAPIRNAVVDDELKQWLQKLTDTEASVLFIADTCHSGTASRNDAMRRGFDVAELSPAAAEAMRRVEATAGRGGVHVVEEATELPAGRGSLVALYASQPEEETYEATFDGARYGLLTYSLCRALIQCDEPITYRELQQRIYATYRERDGYPPTPLLEGLKRAGGGDPRDHEVLGTKSFAERSRLRLRPAAAGKYRLNAGSLHGLSTGSVVAVFEGPGAATGAAVLGHVRLVDVTPLEATAEPCAFGDRPLRADFPADNRGEVVFVDWGLHKLKIGVDRLAAEQLTTLRVRVRRLNEIAGVPVVAVDDERQADWLLQMRDGACYLAPASPGNSRESAAGFGPLPADDEAFHEWLSTRSARIARATNLLQLATKSFDARRENSSVRLDIAMLRYRSAADERPTPVVWQRDGIKLRHGEFVGFRLANRGRAAVDVCLLFVDAGFGISQFFPEPGAAGNRLQPGEKLVTHPGEVTPDTVGWEHLVVVAVAAKPLQAPLDLAFLDQPNCREDNSARGELLTATPKTETPLERFMIDSRNGVGARGFGGAALDSHVLEVLTWETLPP